jgi:hypothetical protein
LAVVVTWQVWPSRKASEAIAGHVVVASWDEAAAGIGGQLGLTAEYRAQWLAGRWRWPDEVDEASIRAELGPSWPPTTPIDLPAFRAAVTPLREEFDAYGSRFLDLLDEEIHKAWSQGRFTASRVDSTGQASFPPTPPATFYTSTIGHAGWAVQFSLRKKEVPELVQLDRTISELVARRPGLVRSVAQLDREAPDGVPSPEAAGAR